MCGIVGYVGGQNTADILLDGLSKLEYRGYDSVGISVADENMIATVKTKGRLADIEKKFAVTSAPKGGCGIGHTRWATHGEPSDTNSHPHCSKQLSLVHNGIIENYLPLREMLEAKGYSFSSETDTEVAALLIDYFYDGDPMGAIKKATAMMRGSYAFAIIFRDFTDRIFALRKDSPLIVAAGDGENFIASDIPAILKRTNRYYLLDEGEIAVLTRDRIVFYNQLGDEIKKELNIAAWDIEAAEKGGYPHFMLKEIHENPRALRDTVAASEKDGLPFFAGVEKKRLKAYRRIIIVACGTAYHAGLMGKAAIEKLARIPVEVELASEFRYRDPILEKDDCVLLITQSGETADTLAALRLAKSRGIDTLAVANVLGSTIPRESDSVIFTCAGPEIAVASTKAYTVQLAIMFVLAIELGLVHGKLSEAEARSLMAELGQMPDKIEETLALAPQMQYISSLLQSSRDIFYIGRGLDYALAMEGSLKLKEISYIHSEAYAAGELKHGTISLVTEGVPVIAFATQTPLYEKMVSNIREVKSRGATIVLLCSHGAENAGQVADHVLRLPEVNELFTPILGAVFLQTFAYYTALARGCDVDKPRNLAKSVTVE